MTRRISACLVLVSSLLFLGIIPAVPAIADGSQPPNAPTTLAMSLPGGTSIAEGTWVASTSVQFHFRANVQTGTLTPQVEIVPADTPFSGQPTFMGAKLTASGAASVTATGLKDGRKYRWQARVVDDSGNASPWVVFSPAAGRAVDFGVDVTPPARPVISSPTNPEENAWYNSQVNRFTWTATDGQSGIKGYTYVLERQAHVIPPGPLTARTGLSVKKLADGVWTLALRAEDRAGNWSPTATFTIHLDRQPPTFTWLSPSRLSFNPFRAPLMVRFEVNKDVSARLDLYRVGSTRPVASYQFAHLKAGIPTSLSWNGRQGHGKYAPRGFYFFSAVGIDHAQNIRRVNLGGIDLSPERGIRAVTGQILYPGAGKRIIVSLSRQELYAYDGTRLVLQTLVTTGNPSLPTPAGSYTILAKYSPFEFISPWPPGSPYWYAPSPVQYAMLFRSGGYFLHDAPWRSAFGPGTNGAGQPGTNYGGTHGCVNIPPGPTTFLYGWAPIGTPVLVAS